MKFIPTLAALTIALLPLTSHGQGNKDCNPSTPASSAAYQEFMKSDLPAKWSTKDFGPLAPSTNGQFLDCSYETGHRGFAMQLAGNNQNVKVLGHVTQNGQNKALVFGVTQTSTREFQVKAHNIDGRLLFQYRLVDGNVTDVQAIGPMNCSETYLVGLVGMAAGVSGGPVGVGIGAACMMYSLWRSGCL